MLTGCVRTILVRRYRLMDKPRRLRMSLAYCLTALPTLPMLYIFLFLPHLLSLIPGDHKLVLWLNYAITLIIRLSVSALVGLPLIYLGLRLRKKVLSPGEMERLRSAWTKAEV